MGIFDTPGRNGPPGRRWLPVRDSSRAILAAVAVGGGALVTVAAPGLAATETCSVDYDVVDEWNDGFQGALAVTNTGPALQGWTLEFDLPAGQTVQQGWSGRFTQSGATVTVTNESWNGSLGSGATVNPGFIGHHGGSVFVPDSFTLNGEECSTGGTTPTTAPSTTSTTASSSTTSPSTTSPSTTSPSTTSPSTTSPSTTSPSTTSPSTTIPGSTTSTTPAVPGERVDNPFVGARGYVNADWQAKVEAQAAATGGALGADMAAIGRYPTAVWMDRIAAIDPPTGMGLRDHLDAAVAQADGQPLTVTVVIYDLPNRDCAALASNGELRISENGLERYRTEYIDEIVSIMADPAYADLRIVNIIEPDSLPNLVTNLNRADCAEAQQSGAYAQGVAYALGQLRTLPNTYAYLDIGHSGWLGWDSNFGPAVNLIADAVKLPAAGVDTVDGFVSNTAGYSPTEEVYLPNSGLTLGGGNPIRSASFFEWNPYFDEVDYVLAMRQAFIGAGLPSDIGMLIDTSRNGWGGDARPDGVSTSTNVDTYVNESRLDQRPHRGGWCNQDGAGIGERPTAAPIAGIDAYVWVKPPGESDGISTAGVIDPDDPAKGFDGMCDPNAQSTYNNAYPTNALPGAPHAGRWFEAQFEMLVSNASPEL